VPGKLIPKECMLNLKTLRPRFLGGRGRRERVRGLFKEFKEFVFNVVIT